ncbi:MAG TPA: AAA family ATPase [Candidatus Krumholzibacteriaceae bacterium]|nr:AAA family ATPase [Candidatus Krumholzibacteriaceae bacterium]
MKVAVAGKGGVGKTLVAGALAYFLTEKGFKVLAIDADSSPNLALTLGISADQALKIVPISENQELIRAKTETPYPGVYRLSFTVDDVVRDFAVKSPFNINLLVMGTIRAAGEGCTCTANALVRSLLRHLIVERNEAVVMDMEAGVEHMGRGTAKHVDTMLIITDSSLKSMETAKKVHTLATQAGIKRIFLVGNKIAEKDEENAIKQFASGNNLVLLDLIPYDEQILKADRKGETPLNYAKSSAGLRVIGRICERLMQ